MDAFSSPQPTQRACVEERRPRAVDRVGTFLEMPAGDVLYRQGEAADSVYYLDSGALTISARSGNGKQTIMGVLGAGTFFGAHSLGKERHATTATALLPSAVVRMAKPVVAELLRTDPEFAASFAKHMMRRAAMVEEERVDHAINPTRKRLARLLLILAGDNAAVLERITADMLAQILGAEPRSIRTLLQDFRHADYLAPGEPLAVRSSLVQVLVPPETGAPAG